MIQKKFEGKWISFMMNGKTEYVERNGKREAAVIIATTDNDELILVEQLRPSHESNVIEFPAGLVDDGETPLQAAIRELEEEAGYGGIRSTNEYGKMTTSPGMTNELVNIFYFSGVKKISEGGGVDEDENIKIHIVKINELDMFLHAKMKNNILIDSKVMSYAIAKSH